MGERLGVLTSEAPMFQKGPLLQAGAPAGSRAQRNLGGGSPERAHSVFLKVYHICHCKVQPPNHRRKRGEEGKTFTAADRLQVSPLHHSGSPGVLSGDTHGQFRAASMCPVWVWTFRALSRARQAWRAGPILATYMGANKSLGNRRDLSEDKGAEEARLGLSHQLGITI